MFSRKQSGQSRTRWALGLSLGCVLAAGAPAQGDPDPFLAPYSGVHPARGERPLLVVLLGPDDPNPGPMRTRADIRQTIFGGTNSVRSLYLENSYGAFTFREAFTTDWLVAQDDPNTTDWDESSMAFIHTSDASQKSAWVIQQVEKMTPFRFSDYDDDGNGVVTNDELCMLWIYPGDGNARQRGTNPAVVPVSSLPQGGVQFRGLIRGGAQMAMTTIAHELGHQAFGLGDLYDGATDSGRYSLMSYGTHLDPWSKIKLGWLKPLVVDRDGWYELEDVEHHPTALILQNPARGRDEYFILENRYPPNSYEQSLPDRGLALWHIEERHEYEGDWARNTIRLTWALGVGNNSAALFDGTDPATGYDLDNLSSPAHTRWYDGMASGIRIRAVSGPGSRMHAFINVSDPSDVPLRAFSGRSFDLDQYRRPYESRSAPGRSPSQIAGMGIAASDDQVFVWYRDGTVSSGTSWDLDEYRAPYAYSLPPGKSPNDIVGMGIAGSNDRVYTWYRDGTVSSGTSWDLDEYRAPYAYSLPAGKSPADIVGMAIAASNDWVYAWYRDGSVSAGSSSDLDMHRSRYGYRMPGGIAPSDIVGMGIASDDAVFAWSRTVESQDPPQPLLPGTGNDLSIETRINLQPGPDLQSARSGDLFAVDVTTPEGSFTHAFRGTVFQVVQSGAIPVQVPDFPGFYLVGSQPYFPLPPSLSLTIPNGLQGLSVLVQGFALSPFAANGFYATTSMHEIRLR